MPCGKKKHKYHYRRIANPGDMSPKYYKYYYRDMPKKATEKLVGKPNFSRWSEARPSTPKGDKCAWCRTALTQKNRSEYSGFFHGKHEPLCKRCAKGVIKLEGSGF